MVAFQLHLCYPYDLVIEMEKIMYSCLSVVGGWQTVETETGVTVGPAFHRIQDLWAWQRANLYS